MSHTERGIYITLLCLCWSEGSLPADLNLIAKLVRVPASRFTKLWTGPIGQCFQLGDNGRYGHKRLDKERLKQEQFRAKQAANGQLGGRPPRKPTGLPDAKGLGSENKALQSSVCNLQSSVSNLPPQSDSGSRWPIYKSDRFVVFDWQLEELSRTLGSHFETFDLHGFFDSLTQQSRSQGLVIPSDRDARWKWLQAQVEAEAKRRGLPIAGAATKSTADMTREVAKILGIDPKKAGIPS